MQRNEIRSRPSLVAAIKLLEAVALPTSDLTDEHMKHFLCCGSESALTGLIGIQVFGRDALLRSLAVASPARGTGLGSSLVQHAEQFAASIGVRTMFLLTTTAEQFFKARGYRSLPRQACPEAIRSTAEFTSLCSTSSALLTKQLIASKH